MLTKQQVAQNNVRSLAAWKSRETAKILDYLAARLQAHDLTGLVVQSIDRRGVERVHMTGIYKADPAKALGAALSLSVKMTAAHGGFEDSGF